MGGGGFPAADLAVVAYEEQRLVGGAVGLGQRAAGGQAATRGGVVLAFGSQRGPVRCEPAGRHQSLRVRVAGLVEHFVSRALFHDLAQIHHDQVIGAGPNHLQIMRDMGGSVGLHGTNGDARRRAEALGAVPIAGKRAVRGLRRLGAAPGARVLAAGGPMGEDIVRSLGWETETAGPPPSAPTTRGDTQAAARAMQEAGADLLLFAGGDGTARDIAEAVGCRTPLLGIPTGVKMHSAVFGDAPEAAGELAARFLKDPGRASLRKR